MVSKIKNMSNKPTEAHIQSSCYIQKAKNVLPTVKKCECIIVRVAISGESNNGFALLHNKFLEDDRRPDPDLFCNNDWLTVHYPSHILLQQNRKKYFYHTLLYSFLEAVKSWEEDLVRGIFQLFWTILVKICCWIAVAHSNKWNYSILALVILASACESLTHLPIKHIQSHSH